MYCCVIISSQKSIKLYIFFFRKVTIVFKKKSNKDNQYKDIVNQMSDKDVKDVKKKH